MNTLSKIGQAALTRLFYSGRKGAHKVEFSTEEFDLTKVVRWERVNDHYGDIQTVGGTNYLVWGIELGLRHLETVEGETFADAIARLLAHENNGTNRAVYHHDGDWIYPSHIIRCSWWGGDMFSNREETYTVYRFTQKQDEEIENLRPLNLPLRMAQ
ncbi:MAG TPA: hypothetical protein VGE35_04145 [Candidatus Paceibacterota bacterium]